MTELTREFGTVEEITDAIDAYRDRERELAAQFEAATPKAVVLSDVEHDDLNEAYDALGKWRAVTRRLCELHEGKPRLKSGSSPASASSHP
ncbi:DUF7342 family protein [Halobellus sp. GM3]|uniref:DUF7342 family protein n=1 Tax=Halobellus sp. GM3 TaxID=3458410 RepID=UPI00403D74EA